MSPETWDTAGGEVFGTGELAERILRSGCSGLTISGGEPFLQAEPLAELAGYIRKEGDMGILVYTGYLYENLQNDSSAAPLLSCADALIDGAFIQEQQDGKSLRGSANQRLIILTERGKEFAADFGNNPCRVEFFTHPELTRMAGIPAPGMLERLRKINW
jgi:anaerobic ribonucleoside-triphosphate reductase activating protein